MNEKRKAKNEKLRCLFLQCETDLEYSRSRSDT
jgi:hypothetical protein